jgi:hypothetical protein
MVAVYVAEALGDKLVEWHGRAAACALALADKREARQALARVGVARAAAAIW